MSTLEKTIDLLRELPENQIEMIYGFVQLLSSKQVKDKIAEELEKDTKALSHADKAKK